MPKATELLKADGVNARVINICTVKPLDEDIILRAVADCRRVVTCEEHNIIGGLGEAVAALLGEKMLTPIRRLGVKDEFGHLGPAWELLKKFGLDAFAIYTVAKQMVAD